MSTPYVRVAQALTISTDAYAAGDVVGGLLTLDASGIVEGSTLNSVLVVDDDDEKAALYLYLFNAAPTTIADNAAFAPTVADLKKLITRVTVPAASYVTLNGNAYVDVTDIGKVLTGFTGSLYGYLVTQAATTPTYTAATDLWLALDFLPAERGKG